MQDFSKFISLETFINRAKSQRRLKIVQRKLEIIQELTRLPLTFNSYACGERAFTNNEIASYIDVMTKNNYGLNVYITMHNVYKHTELDFWSKIKLPVFKFAYHLKFFF